MGYTDVKEYPGGKQDWVRNDLPYQDASSNLQER